MIALSKVAYSPTLGVRPSEMNAVQNLPSATKDRILPIFLLRGWVSSNHFSSTIKKISSVFDDRPLIADIDPIINVTPPIRDVHHTLRGLRSPSDGYRDWCEFIAQHNNFIPCLQLGDLGQIAKQAEYFCEIGKKFVVRLRKENATNLGDILTECSPFLDNALLVNIDYGQQNRDILTSVAECISYVDGVRRFREGMPVTITSTTFPSTFEDVESQNIFERLFFDQLVEQRPENISVFADRGSARDHQQGGGGVLIPRIDVPTESDWWFYRHRIGASETKAQAYARCADSALQSGNLDTAVNIWGVDMINKTAREEPGGIDAPVKSTGVRIHLHLYKQAYVGEADPSALDLDEDWDEAI